MKRTLNSVRRWSATRLLQYTLGVLNRMPAELVSLPEGKRWLVIAPHNDDEAIGVGGILALLGRMNADVDVVFVTGDDRASLGSESAIRWQEAVEVAGQLGFQPIPWRLTDRKVGFQRISFYEGLKAYLAMKKPDVIFCPFPTDHHKDHQSCAHHLAWGLRKLKFEGEIWCYEVWSTLWPNQLIDISPAVDDKRKAIQMYQSQVSILPYDEAAIGLNRYRGLSHGVGFAEALYCCGVHEFYRLTQGLDRI